MNIMNTTEFLKSYKELEMMIENNWESFRKAYNDLGNYSFSVFTIDTDYGDVCIKAEDRYCSDCARVDIPLSWFETEDTLRDHLAEVIKETEERLLREMLEIEKRKIESLKRQQAKLQERINEYYKTHPRESKGGNYN